MVVEICLNGYWETGVRHVDDRSGQGLRCAKYQKLLKRPLREMEAIISGIHNVLSKQ